MKKIKEDFMKDIDIQNCDVDQILRNVVKESRKNQDSENVLVHYFKLAEKIPLLSREEETKLAKLAKEGNKEARNKLILSNLRFVIKVAKSYYNSEIPLSDLIGEGILGLLVAVDKFDYTKGWHFISYAVWWIKQAILKYIAERSRVARFPMNRINEILKIERFVREFELENGRYPSIEEISKATDIKKEDVEILMNRKSRDYISFYDKAFNDSDVTYSDILNVEDQIISTPDEIVLQNSINEEIRKVIDLLSEKEREVIKHRYGFYGRNYSLKEVGEKFNITKERVRQIENKALEKLKEIISSRSSDILPVSRN